MRARGSDPLALPRTQASVAVSADGQRWVLINASPDLGAQIRATPALQPSPAAGVVRASPIAAVVLTGGEVDTIAGLLTLRERHAFDLHAPPAVLAVLAANPIFRVLDPTLVPRTPLGPGAPATVAGLRIEAFAVPGKVPLFNESATSGADADASVGLEITAETGGPRLLVIPGCAMLTAALRDRIDGAACLLFDGTLWDDAEMQRAGAGPKTGARMGHISMSGPDGAIAGIAGLRVGRRVFLHINNTNPALLADSPERAELTRAGWEVAADGMEITL